MTNDTPTFAAMRRAEHRGHFIEVFELPNGEGFEAQLGFIGGRPTESKVFASLAEAQQGAVERVNQRAL